MKKIILSLIVLLSFDTSYGQKLVGKISEAESSISKTVKIKLQILNETKVDIKNKPNANLSENKFVTENRDINIQDTEIVTIQEDVKVSKSQD